MKTGVRKSFLLLLCWGLQCLSASPLVADQAQGEEFERVGFSIGIHDVSDNMVQFTLDGVTFRIPISQLYTILENNEQAPGEIRGGFTMVGLWPGFAPKTRENLGEFLEVPTERDSVRVGVRRYCNAAPDPEIAAQSQCGIIEGMQAKYDVFGWNKSFKKWYFLPSAGDTPPARILSISGMEYQGYRIKNHNTEQQRASDLVYRGVDSNGDMQFSVCTIQTHQDHYNCTIWVPWRERFYLKLSFREAFLPDWQAIHRTVVERLDSYIVTDDTPDPPSNIRWAVFP